MVKLKLLRTGWLFHVLEPRHYVTVYIYTSLRFPINVPTFSTKTTMVDHICAKPTMASKHIFLLLVMIPVEANYLLGERWLPNTFLFLLTLTVRWSSCKLTYYIASYLVSATLASITLHLNKYTKWMIQISIFAGILADEGKVVNYCVWTPLISQLSLVVPWREQWKGWGQMAGGVLARVCCVGPQKA